MHIVIVGNGISGVTAARFIRKWSDHSITIISKETQYFFSRTALMYAYMGHMKIDDLKPYEDFFWKKNNIDLLQDEVIKINYKDQLLIMDKSNNISYDKLILATGSSPNKFGWPGQDLNRVGGLYSKQDLDYIEKYSQNLKRAVIVGGGLIGIELAEMFHSRHIPVTFLIREDNYWDAVLPLEESLIVKKHILEHGIDLRTQTELKEIVDDGDGNACAVITNKGERIDCQFVGLTAGVHPNIKFLKESELETNRGIKVNEYLETNIPNVYAIGDCAEQQNPMPNRRAIEAIWYTGKMMGETVAHTICKDRIGYNPGIWFNSAKFFDIEYQVYGNISSKPLENHQSIFWEDISSKKSIRIVYNKENDSILGFNLMGIRYRHEVCEKWIRENTNIDIVMENLGLANFDPEFYKTYESEILEIYNKKSGKSISLNRKSKWNQVFSFLNS